MTTVSDAMDILTILHDEIICDPDEDATRKYISLARTTLGAINSKVLKLEVSTVDLMEAMELREDEWSEAERRLKEEIPLTGTISLNGKDLNATNITFRRGRL